MEVEDAETRAGRADVVGKVLEPGQEPLPCCVLQTVEREGREVTVCVATCCGADEAASNWGS
jgi:hypothetical protein